MKRAGSALQPPMAVSMKVMKIPKYEIVPPKSKSFNIETSPDMLPMHQLSVAVGKRGGGKVR